ncbi:MAG: DUF4837 family protein [Bacteroidales bacterium]|jgi:hypothetical protein|nr:DUF4837 family protein [Bacteroidales bacterium]
MNTVLNKLWLVCLAGLLASCSLQSNNLPNATGRQGEIIIVIDRTLWTGACGDTIRHYLAFPIDGLPADEPVFTLLQQQELRGTTQNARNLIIVNIDPASPKSSLGYQNDVYAKGQLAFNITAPNADSVVACVNRYKELLLDRFLAKDRNDYIRYYQNVADNSFSQKTQEKFQVSITIPKEYSLAMEKDDFLWFTREEKDMILGILMWKEPYTSTEQLTEDRLLAQMDAMTKQYITGKTAGSYMATVRKLPAYEEAPEIALPPTVKQFTNNDTYTVQLNGLWQMEHEPMGGPYVSLSIVDAQRNQIVTGMGFVFFPRKEKRNYVRMLEAILYTMKPVQ